MANYDINQIVNETILSINAAITNMHLYPLSSAIVESSLNKVHKTIRVMIEIENYLEFTESDNKLLINQEQLSQKDMDKPQSIAFLNIMINFNIKNVYFKPGLKKKELKFFLEVLSKDPNIVKSEAGILFASKENTPHIIINKERDADSEEFEQDYISISDEVLQYIIGESLPTETELNEIREISKNSDLVLQLFEEGIEQILDKDESQSLKSVNQLNSISHMLQVISDISDDENKINITRVIARFFSKMDSVAISNILCIDHEYIFEEFLFDEILNQLDNMKLETLTAEIENMESAAPDGSGRKNLIISTYKKIVHHKKNRLKKNTKRKSITEDKTEIKRNEAVEAEITKIINGDINTLEDKSVFESIIFYVEKTLLNNDDNKVYSLIDGLIDIIIERDDPESKLEPVFRMLERFSQILIRNKYFIEANRVIDIFSQVFTGQVNRKQKTRILVGHILEEIASNEILELLLSEIQPNEENDQNYAFQCLVGIGSVSISPLLNLLRESRGMSERVRIMRVISELGEAAAIEIIERIGKGETWFYMRNLIMLLGKTGNVTHLNILKSYLGHEDFRIRRAALNSIFDISEEKRGEILISLLPSVDERLKISVVSMLGSIKYKPAVETLIDILKIKPIISKDIRNELEEKICLALGVIGSNEAVPILTEIAGQKRLFSIKSHNTRVKAAARKALEQIQLNEVDLPDNETPESSTTHQDTAEDYLDTIELDKRHEIRDAEKTDGFELDDSSSDDADDIQITDMVSKPEPEPDSRSDEIPELEASAENENISDSRKVVMEPEPSITDAVIDPKSGENSETASNIESPPSSDKQMTDVRLSPASKSVKEKTTDEKPDLSKPIVKKAAEKGKTDDETSKRVIEPVKKQKTPVKTVTEKKLDWIKQEKMVDLYIRKNRKETAVKLLLNLIVKYSRIKNFKKAESLRERLYKTDPMALAEIVKAEDIIEEEKNESIDKEHSEIWAELYDSLDTREANALYYSMKELFLEPEQYIVEQGQLNSNLYFINHGSLKMFHQQNDDQLFLKELGTGDIVGQNTFFSGNICTVSVLALSNVRLNILEKSLLKTWNDELPGLVSKLTDFCLKFDKPFDLLQKGGFERRILERIKIEGDIIIQLFNASQKPIGSSFKGDLIDISKGGVAFKIKTATRMESGRTLLGRNLNMNFVLPIDDTLKKIQQNGLIIGIKHLGFNDYSLHVKFNELFAEEMLEKIKKS